MKRRLKNVKKKLKRPLKRLKDLPRKLKKPHNWLKRLKGRGWRMRRGSWSSLLHRRLKRGRKRLSLHNKLLPNPSSLLFRGLNPLPHFSLLEIQISNKFRSRSRLKIPRVLFNINVMSRWLKNNSRLTHWLEHSRTSFSGTIRDFPRIK